MNSGPKSTYVRARGRLVLFSFALLAAACSTVGDSFEEQGANPLSFIDDETETSSTTTTAESEVSDGNGVAAGNPGTAFPDAEVGPTMVAAGPDGVWWYDAEGASQLLVERSAGVAYDGAGGLVFQRSNFADVESNGVGAEGQYDTTIVHHTNNAEQFDLVVPAVNEAVDLHGVTVIGSGVELVFTRYSFAGEDDPTATLERINIETGETTELVSVWEPGRRVTNITVTGSYASGMVRTSEGSGWVIYELRSGARLSGSADSEFSACASDQNPLCRRLLTIRGDGNQLIEVFPAGDNADNFELVVRQASNGAEITRTDLKREADTWIPQRVEPAGDLVIVSRSTDAEGRAPIPAMVVNPATGDITQLSEAGVVSVISANS